MAAGMQQHHALRRQGLQRRQESVELHAVGFGVIPGIGIHLKTGARKDGDMVFPGRIADPYLRLREIAFQKVRAYFQRAGAAYGLDGGDAVRL